MSDTVVQWLAEIRNLKQRLTEIQQELDATKESESNWRQLYSQEAQQRRTEAKLAQEQIKQLKTEIQQLQAGLQLPQVDNPNADAAIAAEVSALNSIEVLQGKLIEAIKEKERALESLKLEQENHAKTRKSLTAVISDTVDQLTKLKGEIPPSV